MLLIQLAFHCREYKECHMNCSGAMTLAVAAEMHRRAASLVANAAHSLSKYATPLQSLNAFA